MTAARIANDSIARAIASAPHRFQGYATLPVPHVDAALAETARALDDLGLIGITLPATCQGWLMADPMFDPLLAEIDRRAAVLFIHPMVNGLCPP